MNEVVRSKFLSVHLFIASLGAALGLASTGLSAAVILHPMATDPARVVGVLCIVGFMVAMAFFASAMVFYFSSLESEYAHDLIGESKKHESEANQNNANKGTGPIPFNKKSFMQGAMSALRMTIEWKETVSKVMAALGSLLCLVSFVVSAVCVVLVAY